MVDVDLVDLGFVGDPSRASCPRPPGRVRHGADPQHERVNLLTLHAARLRERVVVLDHGAVIFDGPTAEGLDVYRREALVA